MKKIRPYFRHKSDKENPCKYYTNPTEAQIHKDAKFKLKELIETKNIKIKRKNSNSSNVYYDSSDDDSSDNDSSDDEEVYYDSSDDEEVFYNNKIKCYNCGKFGHYSNNCYSNNCYSKKGNYYDSDSY